MSLILIILVEPFLDTEDRDEFAKMKKFHKSKAGSSAGRFLSRRGRKLLGKLIDSFFEPDICIVKGWCNIIITMVGYPVNPLRAPKVLAVSAR